MKYYIQIFTDNNRQKLQVSIKPNIDLINHNNEIGQHPSCTRLVYQEIHETEKTAAQRMNELDGYTRMQLERLIRRSNPNWNNLFLKENVRFNQLKDSISSLRHYHPGAKLRPNVPNLTSLR